MGKAHAVIVKIHRISAIIFLLSIPPAAYTSFTGDPDAPSPLVYVPLLPLFALIVTGIYQLVRPWIRAGRAPAQREQGV